MQPQAWVTTANTLADRIPLCACGAVLYHLQCMAHSNARCWLSEGQRRGKARRDAQEFWP